MQNKLTIILVAVLLYILSSGASFAFFSLAMPSKPVIAAPTPGASGDLSAEDTGPKTEACPINGAMYSKNQRTLWETRRPLGVMIENHLDARPQSGLSFADTVYEAVAEGGITRFLAIYYCKDAPEVGPVRSARTYFIDFASEYADYPLYAHVGGANADGPADALGQLDTYGWTGYNDLNQFSIGFPTFWRDYDRLGHDVATEHTMYSSTAKLWAVGKDRGLTNVDKKGNAWNTKFVPYQFKDDANLASRSTSQVLHLEFWSSQPDYFVDWTYNKQNNVYMRQNAGKPHLDRDTNKQLTTKNIVVLFIKELNADDGYENNIHLLYQNKGTGKAAVFMDGKQIQAKWEKDSRTSRTLLFDTSGNQIQFDRGTIWFTVLPLDIRFYYIKIPHQAS